MPARKEKTLSTTTRDPHTLEDSHREKEKKNLTLRIGEGHFSAKEKGDRKKECMGERKKKKIWTEGHSSVPWKKKEEGLAFRQLEGVIKGAFMVLRITEKKGGALSGGTGKQERIRSGKGQSLELRGSQKLIVTSKEGVPSSNTNWERSQRNRGFGKEKKDGLSPK